MASSSLLKAQEWVEYLNDLLDRDQQWVTGLFLVRASCNAAIATHKHIPVMNTAEPKKETPRGYVGVHVLADMPTPQWEAGILGLINGQVGTGLRGRPLIQARLTKQGLIQRFELTPTAKKDLGIL